MHIYGIISITSGSIADYSGPAVLAAILKRIPRDIEYQLFPLNDSGDDQYCWNVVC